MYDIYALGISIEDNCREGLGIDLTLLLNQWKLSNMTINSIDTLMEPIQDALRKDPDEVMEIDSAVDSNVTAVDEPMAPILYQYDSIDTHLVREVSTIHS